MPVARETKTTAVVLRRRAERRGEPERSERGAVAVCGETSFRPYRGRRALGSRPPWPARRVKTLRLGRCQTRFAL